MLRVGVCFLQKRSLKIRTSMEPVIAEAILPERADLSIPDIPQESEPIRRHDLDALRAIAMLLGIVLHAALSFAPIPWSVKDSQESSFFSVLFASIHGFRMPLFFLLSGFFTAMMWRKRGLRGLLQQRLKRIALPLALCCFSILPVTWAVIYFVNRPSNVQADHAEIWQAVVAGDTERVQAAIGTSEIAIDAVSQDGATLLTVAVFLGHSDMAEMLIQSGADVHQRNRDQGTALHSAAFIGRAEEAKMLLDAGANPDATDVNGQSPKDLLKTDFGTTNFIATSFGLSLEEETLKAGRAEIAKQMGVKDYLGSRTGSPVNAGLQGLQVLLFQFPFFMHLWFLWFLCWLVAAFVVYATFANRLRPQRIPKWILCSPFSLLWLVPMTMIPQAWMNPSTFGPDPSVGLLPLPSVLAYYAIFFFFGALYWDADDTNGRLGRSWAVCLPVALLVVFPLGLVVVSGWGQLLPLSNESTGRALLGSFLQALFAWLMIFGSIGLCHRWLSRESKAMRYISDSSYWLYLAHLPLVLLAQWCVRDLPLPAIVKFTGIVVIVSAFLLLTYEYGVRYTVIGRILNGPRHRTP